MKKGGLNNRKELSLKEEIEEITLPQKNTKPKSIEKKSSHPKKKMKSVRVVLLSCLITVLLGAIGFSGYLYWQSNFSQKESLEQPEIQAEIISGQKIVAVTSDREKLFVSFINPETGDKIVKQIDIGVTVGNNSNNKNPYIQFSRDGEYFIVQEVKEASFSDSKEFSKFVKYSKDGQDKETLLEKEDSLFLGDFILDQNKIYYLGSETKNNLTTWNLNLYDLEKKESQILLEDIGDFFEGPIMIYDNKIYSLYQTRSYIALSIYDTDTKDFSQRNLIRAVKNRDFELTLDDIWYYPSAEKIIYKNYSSYEGYSLKAYDLTSREIETLIKDKNYIFDDVKWLDKNNFLLVKNSVFSSEEKSYNQLIKFNFVDEEDKQEVLLSSESIITPLILDKNLLVYYENDLIKSKKDEKNLEIKPKGYLAPRDILFLGLFTY